MRKRISFGFAAITMIAVAFGAFAIVRLNEIRSHTDHILLVSLPAMTRAANLAEQFQALGDKSSVLFMKEIMSPSDDLRADFVTQIQANLKTGDNLAADFERNLVNSEGKRLFSDFRAALNTYEEVFGRGLNLCNGGKTQEAMMPVQCKVDLTHS